jgi:pimeloyl-ACP methyl ester carboxylesterase
MTNFVLVHGAWHGGWCWTRVSRLLRRAGHDVFTPTLTGLGERAHLASADINLDTHIADILGVLESEELDDVVLCGHSYGGMVISGVAERAGGRIDTLAYLDAHVPEDGQSVLQLLGAARAEAIRAQASRTGDGWRIDPVSAEAFQVGEADDVKWVDRQCTAQPIATFGQPIALTGAIGRVRRRVYIRADNDRVTAFAHCAEHAGHAPDWDYHEVAAGHDVMIDAPEALAGILLEAVAG